ncbi:MAG: addiction module protein [Cellvibrionaceae bacterium]|nr:addiction module protein [Cellvibrionaceae bacterium]
MEIQSLAISERIILAEALWDSVVAEDSGIELTGSQEEELDRRLAAFEVGQNIGFPWSSLRARIPSKK